jgi:uncharacterized protein (TIGR03083 family)
MDTWARIVNLRTALVEQLSNLPAERWDSPTLCPGWRVRDVVAHLILPSRMPSVNGVMGLARSGFSLRGYIHNDAIHRGSMPLADLVATFREAVDRETLPPGRSPENLLADLFIHSQDIRRPLVLPWQYEPEVLTTVAHTIITDQALGVPERVAGLALGATDVAWSTGTGQPVTGPAEALILAMSGRRAALAELSGAGLPALGGRR